MPRVVRAALVVAVLAAIACGGANVRAAPRTAAKRLVAIADVHGDLDAFVAILKRAHLVDDRLAWAGGDATLVQLGDMIDRGPKSRGVLDLVMALQKDARRTGGRVVPLLGNHEVLNLFGDLRYVMPSDYASFADGESVRRQQDAYQAYLKAMGDSAVGTREEWMAAHPPGFVEQREAFSADGKYGKWLRTLSAVEKIDDTLFVHGGISEAMSSWSISRLNDRVAFEIRSFDDVRQLLVSRKLAAPTPTLAEVLTGVGLAAEPEDERDRSAAQLRQLADDRRGRSALVPRVREARRRGGRAACGDGP